MRLLCDEMLGLLARWLRAAGHDTALAVAGNPDNDLLRLARAEDRVLLTRDRHLATHAPADVSIVPLRSHDLDTQAADLKTALGLDWLAAPFTRCLLDNAALREASAAEIARIPRSSAGGPGPFRTCTACGRIYWPGSHVRRMTSRLERWAHS